MYAPDRNTSLYFEYQSGDYSGGISYCNQTLDPCSDNGWNFIEIQLPGLSNIGGLPVANNGQARGTPQQFKSATNRGENIYIQGEHCTYTLSISGWANEGNYPIISILQDLNSTSWALGDHDKLISLNGKPTIFNGTGQTVKQLNVSWTDLPALTGNYSGFLSVMVVPDAWLCGTTTLITTISSTFQTSPPSTHSTITSPPSTHSTITSQPSTHSTISTISSENCKGVDGRDNYWNVIAEDCETKDCSSENKDLVGTVRWCCGVSGEFITPQPDGSNCTDTWVGEIDQMFKTNETATDIASSIGNNLTYYANPSGGTIVKVAEYLKEITDMNKIEIDDYDIYLGNITYSVSQLFGSYLGWQEIGNDTTRFDVASSCLHTLDYSANEWSLNITANGDCGSTKLMVFSQVETKVINLDKEISDKPWCYSFSSAETICLDDSYVEKCATLVSSLIKIKENKWSAASYMFPGGKDEKSLLGGKLLGLTVFKKGTNITQTSNLTIDVSFKHQDLYNQDGCVLVPKAPTCMFWNLTTSNWSTYGCKMKQFNMAETVCSCDHLTNFGIMLDWRNEALAKDPVLDIISTVLLSLSIASLILTESLLFLVRKEQSRDISTINRNICLLLGQLAFMTLVNTAHLVNCNACEYMGALTHTFWLSFFFWTVNDGYILFNRLKFPLKVFDNFTRISYLVCYGVPLIFVSGFLLIDFLKEQFFYLRRTDDGEVNCCWLHKEALLTLIIPVGLTVIINGCVTMISVNVAHKSMKQSFSFKRSKTIKKSVRNAIFISMALGISYAVGFLPSWVVEQYTFVGINASMGTFILYQEVFRKTEVRGHLRRVFTTLLSGGLQQQGDLVQYKDKRFLFCFGELRMLQKSVKSFKVFDIGEEVVYHEQMFDGSLCIVPTLQIKEIFLDLVVHVPNNTTPLKMAEDFVKNYQVDKADFSELTSFETISSTISVEVNHKEEFVKSIFTSHEDSQDVGRNTSSRSYDVNEHFYSNRSMEASIQRDNEYRQSVTRPMRRTRHENRAQEAPDTRRTQISRGISLNTNGKPDTRRTQISRGVSLNINRKSQQPGIIDELIESARLKEQRRAARRGNLNSDTSITR